MSFSIGISRTVTVGKKFQWPYYIRVTGGRDLPTAVMTGFQGKTFTVQEKLGATAVLQGPFRIPHYLTSPVGPALGKCAPTGRSCGDETSKMTIVGKTKHG
ncbi:hypothetical protein [Rhizobium sp. BK251]|uniref:hypothetical protein n=1 Tax=Rhizobium sp. BK251 TaxID=2512125 RepID=UPI0010454492|nr:hypothetical protein [Rhizobium sp. BK251]